MRRNTKIWLVLILSLITSRSWSGEADSLKMLMQGLPDNKQKIEVLYELWYYYVDDSIPQALHYINKQKELSQSMKDDFWLARSYFSLGYTYKQQGYLGKAVSNYVYAIEIYKNIDEPELLAKSYYNLANLFLLAEDFSNAKIYYEESLKFYKDNREGRMLTWIYHGIGECYAGLQKFEKAITTYRIALDEARAKKIENSINELYNTIGVLYQDTEMFELARENFYLSIEHQDYELDKAIAYNNIGETYLEEGDMDNAEKFFSESLKIKHTLKENNASKVITYVNMGKMYKKIEDYNMAKIYLDTAINLASLNKIDKGAMEALELINEVHNVEAISEIYPNGQKMLKYENIRTAQMNLLSDLNNKLSPLKNRYLLQVNYEVPMLSSKLSSALNSKKINSKLAIIAGILALVTIAFMTYYMRKVFVARRMLSKF